jgi:hypothetical protein
MNKKNSHFDWLTDNFKARANCCLSESGVTLLLTELFESQSLVKSCRLLYFFKAILCVFGDPFGVKELGERDLTSIETMSQ